MKSIKKVLSSIIAAVFTANMPLSNMATVIAEIDIVSSNTDKVTVSDELPNLESESEHAYDPMAEIEAQKIEQQLRESVEITENKILFSVIDYRKENEKAVYIDDSNALCKENKLTNISLVYETKNDLYDNISGYDSYEVFYEAFTTSDVWEVVDELKNNEIIVSAEPDFIWENSAEGTYIEVSEEEFANASHFEILDTKNVWGGLKSSKVPGKGVVVAVIDTGVDYNHKDLADNIWVNANEIPDNGVDDDGNGYIDDIHGIDLIENDCDPMDDHGHGTHVAGIIAMTPGNGKGVGLAYGADIMCIKAGQTDGTFASSDIAKAVKYAVDNGADVINMSFGGTGRSTLVEAALRDAFATTVLVASAGNNGLPTTDAYPAYLVWEDIYPAGYSYVLGVMASTNNDLLADFSNWDYIVGKNCEYELIAPGVGIYSTLPNNRYASWSGTSMAAPNVAAAAAIIRSEYPEKSKYTSRYIMGQLVSATTSSVTYVDKNKVEHIYSRLNIKDSLKLQPTPDLTVKEIYTFDTADIDSANNNDGIAQPGEVIDLGLSVWNRWGAATDVTVKIDAVSSGGVENPYVEFIEDEITLEDVGTFAEVNNGWTYDNEALSSVSSPLRFRIKEGTPNDARIQFNINVTAKNALDGKDKKDYTILPKPSYTVVVQNGYALSGVIHEDMTLTSDKYWIIENNVLIPEGVTVTVEPGTQIQFWSADPSNPYADSADVFIQVEGKFIAEGTEDEPIEMFPGKGYEERGVCFYSGENEEGYIELKYTNLINVGAVGGHRYGFTADILDHCRLFNGYPDQFKAEKIVATNISNVSAVMYVGDLKCVQLCYKENLIVSEWKNISDSTILCLPNFKSSITGISRDEEFVFYNNSILTDFSRYCIATGYGHKVINISGNYWGTENQALVKKQVLDADKNISYNDLIQEPFLTLEDDMSSIYPFMTEAYLTDEDGNRIETVNGSQSVTMHVKFNRDMASDVQPMVTYGGSEPYTDYYVNGDWVSPREWAGELEIDPFIDMGRMYIRTKGAAAADDKWLVTGEDTGRFFFEITTNSAQSMSLQGNGSKGANELSWLQDDYSTLAGYNLYRSLSYDASTNIADQEFTKINQSIISADELSFIDENVEQGTDYFYYFTVIDTSFNESKPSNVVKCTPTDEEKPIIEHTAIKNAVTGESLTVSANITDNVNVENVKLNYRKSGGEWTSVLMRNISDSLYRAVISSYEIGEEPIEYYITAYDGTNTSYCGSKDKPILIEMNTEHNYDEGMVTKEATCTEAGEITYTCIDCQNIMIEPIEATGHNWSEEWIVDTEPTCTTVGAKSHHCTICDEITDVTEVDIIPHIYDGGKVIESNSCTADGKTKYTCIECGYIDEPIVPATGHKYIDTIVDPECDAKGYVLHNCENCGDSYKSDFTDTVEHEYVETILNPVSCTANGLLQKKCSLCEDAVTEVIPATGHSFKDEITEPDCRTQGYTTHTCENCGFSYVDTYIPASGHAFGEWEASEEPGCNKEGLNIRKCTNCDEAETEVIPAIEHNYHSETVDPTEESEGYKEYICDNCGYRYIYEFIDKLEPTEQVKKGDVDNDGEITLKDVVIIRRFVIGGWDIEIKTESADINDDNIVDLKDVVLLRRYIVGGWEIELE